MCKYAFCEQCMDDIEYDIVDNVPMSEALNGKEYHFFGKEARCRNCGESLYVSEINDYNLEMLYNEYRKENGIISLKDVRNLPWQYRMTCADLSAFLGWPENEFQRFYDGDIPSIEKSEILKCLKNKGKK